MDSIAAIIDRLRSMQTVWGRVPMRARLRTLGQLAKEIAVNADSLVTDGSRVGEQLASEVLPLAEACRYVARSGARVLAPRWLAGRNRAWWMGSIGVLELREAYGVVLIIGPGNYPLLLPGVQLVQALAAGNAVVVKPAPGGSAAIEQLVELCVRAGVPKGLIEILPTDASCAQSAIEIGVDKVVFTGSHRTGQMVARQLAQSITPAALELSGNDPVFVLDDADLQRVSASVTYALMLNGGQSCIAPRRLFATADTLQRLAPILAAQIGQCPPVRLPSASFLYARVAVEEAIEQGAKLACGEIARGQSPESAHAIVLKGVSPEMRVARDDLFAPVLSLLQVNDMSDAIQQASRCRYALGASIFGTEVKAAELAKSVIAGCVTINDVLVPTADPRVSFGGWQASGYGVTRGAEGLKEMSRLKIVCQRSGSWLPHLSTKSASLAPLMKGLLLLRHGQSIRNRWSGVKLLMKQRNVGNDTFLE